MSRHLPFAVVTLLGVAALGLSLGQPAAARSLSLCESQSDCPPGRFCQGGVCQEAPALGDGRPLFGLGIPTFLNPGGDSPKLARRAAQTLRRTLGALGVFRVLERPYRQEGAPLEVQTPTGFDVHAWHQSGAYAMLFGALWPTKRGGWVLEVRLVDVETGRTVPLTSEHQEVGKRGLRAAINRVANELVAHYTGRPGLLGTRIAFARKLKGGAKEIFTVDLSGEVEQQVTRNGSLNVIPSWSPDGALAYTSYKDGNPDLYIEGRKFSSFPDLNTGAAFSPDGRTVALTLAKDDNPEIYLLDRRTGRVVRRLTDHPAIDTSPQWSPDGRRLVFVSDRIGAPQLYVMNADGTNVRALTSEGYNTNPSWSPAADVVVYDRLITAERSDLYKVDVATGTITRLTANRWSSEDPCFSPDGRQIVFTSKKDGLSHLYLMNADGSNVRQLTRGEGPYGSPSWSPPLRVLEHHGRLKSGESG